MFVSSSFETTDGGTLCSSVVQSTTDNSRTRGRDKYNDVVLLIQAPASGLGAGMYRLPGGSTTHPVVYFFTS